jgi:hypothetical protein
VKYETIKINSIDHEVRRCATSVKNLTLLFHASRSQVYSRENQAFLIEGTDFDSINRLMSIKEDVELWARSSISAIGTLLALVDHAELNQSESQTVGWLLVGLGGLQDVLFEAGIPLDNTKEALLNPEPASETKPSDNEKATKTPRQP